MERTQHIQFSVPRLFDVTASKMAAAPQGDSARREGGKRRPAAAGPEAGEKLSWPFQHLVMALEICCATEPLPTLNQGYGAQSEYEPLVQKVRDTDTWRATPPLCAALTAPKFFRKVQDLTRDFDPVSRRVKVAKATGAGTIELAHLVDLVEKLYNARKAGEAEQSNKKKKKTTDDLYKELTGRWNVASGTGTCPPKRYRAVMRALVQWRKDTSQAIPPVAAWPAAMPSPTVPFGEEPQELLSDSDDDEIEESYGNGEGGEELKPAATPVPHTPDSTTSKPSTDISEQDGPATPPSSSIWLPPSEIKGAPPCKQRTNTQRQSSDLKKQLGSAFALQGKAAKADAEAKCLKAEALMIEAKAKLAVHTCSGADCVCRYTRAELATIPDVGPFGKCGGCGHPVGLHP